MFSTLAPTTDIARVCYFFCKFVHILPLDGPTNVPVFMHDARAASQFAAMLGWLAPADPLQFAAASLHEEAFAGAMLPRSRSAIVGVKRRIAYFSFFAFQTITSVSPCSRWLPTRSGFAGRAE
jgi:hypothetical protein